MCEDKPPDFSIAFSPAVFLIFSGLQKPSAKCQKQAWMVELAWLSYSSPDILTFFVQLLCLHWYFKPMFLRPHWRQKDEDASSTNEFSRNECSKYLLSSMFLFKGTVHPKTKFFWKCPHSYAIQDVDEIVSSSDLEKCSIASLATQWMLCSEWVPSEWESKQLIKTSQSSTSNPHHSSPSVNILRS